MTFPRSRLPRRPRPPVHQNSELSTPPLLRRTDLHQEPPAGVPWRAAALWMAAAVLGAAAALVWWAPASLTTWLPPGWQPVPAVAGDGSGGADPGGGSRGPGDGSGTPDGGAPGETAWWDPPPDEVATILIGGELDLGGAVGQRLATGTDLLYPFAGLAATVRSADLALATLETPLRADQPAGPPADATATAPAAPAPAAPAKAAPAPAALVLAAAGFDAVSLATEHGLDLGPEGLARTRSLLAAAGVTAVGAGAGWTEAAAPAIFNVRGTRVAVIGVNDVGPPDQLAAAADQAGVLWAEGSGLRRALAAARQEADLVIVLVHWGNAEVAQPDARQAELARFLAREGADLIVGTGPGVRQPGAFVQGRPVFYSLGPLAGPAAGDGWSLQVRVYRGQVLAVSLLPHRLTPAGDPAPAPELRAGRHWVELSDGGLALLQGAPEKGEGDLVALHRLPQPPTCPPGLYRVSEVLPDSISLQREGFRGSRYWLTQPDDPAGCARVAPATLADLADLLPVDALVRVHVSTE